MDPLKFTVHNLLSINGDSYSGPMGPVLFAQEIMGLLHLSFNRLARIWFEDEELLQNHEDYYLTSHDTLIIGQQFTNRLWLSLWVDEGIKGIPVAKAFSGETVSISAGFNNAEYAKKPTVEEIQQVFNYLFANPHEITPIIK